MLVALAAAFGVVSHHLGGLRAATEQVSRQYPALLTIRGAQDYFSPGIWLGFVVLWVVADPLMPHLWTRMYVARSPRVLTRMALLFPLVCLVVFFFPVWIGVLGRPVIPGLVGPETDRILPLLMTELAPSWLAAVVLSGALAALVSTADSQALALSSILTRDVYKTYLRPRASNRQQLRVARLMLAVLFVFGFLIAVRPVSTLVAITTVAFTGIGVLYPATMAALYWRRATTPAVLASVVSGEVISVLLTWHLLPSWLTLGSLPIIPGLLTATGVLVLVSYLTTPSVESHRP